MKSTSKSENKSRVGRAFSTYNSDFVDQARKRIVECELQHHDKGEYESFDCSSKTSFMLPNINDFEHELGTFMKKDLIDSNSFTNLHRLGCLNWWADIGACRKLFPLSTAGDGNCLLHACSLGMWGFHDRLLILRKALYIMMKQEKGPIKRRWKYALWKDNMAVGGLTYTRDEWEEEWDEVVKLTSDHRKTQNIDRRARKISRASIYSIPQMGLSQIECEEGLKINESLDSLEPIHVYALCNLLRRPIVIIADKFLKDKDGNPLAPIPFGGVYLPLECDPSECYRYPLVLAYDSSHFSALVPAQGEEISMHGEKLSTSVPMQNSDFSLLSIKYTIDPKNAWDLVQDDSMKEELTEMNFEEKLLLLQKYMNIVRVPFAGGHGTVSLQKRQSGSLKQKKALSPTINAALGTVSDLFTGQVFDSNSLISAKLNVTNVPRHYTEMIKNYMDSARERLQIQIAGNKEHANKESTTSKNVSGSQAIPIPSTSKSKSKGLLVDVVKSPTTNISNKVSSTESTMSTGSNSTAERNSRTNVTKPSTKMSPIAEKPPSLGVDSEIRNDWIMVGTECISPGCRFYGSPKSDNYCSYCHKHRKSSN